MDREARLAELRAACGCKEALMGLAFAVAAYMFLPQYFPHRETTWSAVQIGFAVALGGAITGKLAGLLIAQMRLRRILGKRTPADHF